MEDTGFSIALFLHIVGALGIFAGLGLEWTGLAQLRKAASPDQVRPWMGVFKSSRSLGFVSMLVAVVTGLYMVVADVGPTPWVLVTLGVLVLLIVFSAAVTGPRMAAIGRLLPAEKPPVSDAFRRLAGSPALTLSLRLRLALALGIVFLKVLQPDWPGSLSTVAAAMLLAYGSTLPFPRPVPASETSTH